jgi:hypothetical protein
MPDIFFGWYAGWNKAAKNGWFQLLFRFAHESGGATRSDQMQSFEPGLASGGSITVHNQKEPR